MKFFITIYIVLLSLVASSQNCLIASYPFCGNADDISGNSFHGTVNGANPTTDRYGYPNSAMKFDGINDFIQVSHNNMFNFNTNQNFTISVWIQTDVNQALVSSNQRNNIIDKFYDSGSNSYGFPYSVRINNQATSRNGQISLYRKDLNSCNNKPEARSDSLVNDSLWHHIAMVRQDTVIKLYIDGFLDTIVMDVTTCSTTNTFDLYFGAKGGSGNRGYFKGAIDDIKIYNCALDSSEIQTLLCEDTYCAKKTICPGDSTVLGGIYRSTPGIYTDSFINVRSCDSIKVTELIVDSITVTTDSAIICSGDSLLIYGQYQSQQGIYYDTTQNSKGCDSVLEFKLLLKPLPNKYSTVDLCQGDSILINNVYIKESGIYQEKITNTFGCDTINNISVTTRNIVATINVLQTILYTNYVGGKYQWFECVAQQIIPGATNSQYSVLQNGTYAVIVSDYGCVDTSECVTIIIGGISYEKLNDISIYPNPSNGLIFIYSPTKVNADIKLTSTLGEVVYHSNTVLIDIQPFVFPEHCNGIYFLKLITEKGTLLKRIVINQPR